MKNKIPITSKADLHKTIYEWPTKYAAGFIYTEIKELLSLFDERDLNMKKWDNAMMGNTCMVSEDGIISYHCDVLLALSCALEDREQTINEWD